MKKLFSFFLIFLACKLVKAQNYQSDWDVYMMQSGKKPVSVMVDLGIHTAAPLGEKPNLIILHLKFKDTSDNGMPTVPEIKNLDMIEESFIQRIESGLDAVYVGRYTKDGKRDFFFYTNDTSRYQNIFSESMKAFPNYTWSATAKKDAGWSDYFDVLYPTPRELERLKNRKGVENLRSKGDKLTEPRRVEHWIYFRSTEDRKEFAALVQDQRFEVLGATEEKGMNGYSYGLHIARLDKVDLTSIDKVTLYLWELAMKNKGRYDGWETDVVK